MNGHPKNLRVAPAGTANGAKVDPNDPQVRKLVYNAYREMLSKKHADANVIVDNAPQELVTEDQGVGSRVESMMRQQSELKGGNMNAGGPPPPPPPPPIPGVIPSSRLPSEIPPRPAMNTPPAALAGAMMKDRKPFTYTPGGLDLSEISNQYPPNQNGNNVDQAPNNADFGAPVQSRSFRVLQNVLDHHDTTDTPTSGAPMKVEVPPSSPRPYSSQQRGSFSLQECQKDSISQIVEAKRGNLPQQSGQMPRGPSEKRGSLSGQGAGGPRGSISQSINDKRGPFQQPSGGKRGSIPSINNNQAPFSRPNGYRGSVGNIRNTSNQENNRQGVVPQTDGLRIVQHSVGGVSKIILGQNGESEPTSPVTKELSNIFKNQVRISANTDEARTRGGHFPKESFNSGQKTEPQGPIHIPNMRQVQPPSQYQPQPNQYQQQPEYQQQTGPYLQSGVNNNAASTEQAIPEPKKYMGGSIPSRSFRMLQAMTGADDATDAGEPANTSESSGQPDDDTQHSANQIPSPNCKSSVPTSPSSLSPLTNVESQDVSSDSGISSPSKIGSYTIGKDNKVYRHVSPKITFNGSRERVVNSALCNSREPSSPTWKTVNCQPSQCFPPVNQPSQDSENKDQESPRLMKIIREESVSPNPQNEQNVERRYEGGHIPSRVFRHLQSEYPSGNPNELQEPKVRVGSKSPSPRYEGGCIPPRVLKSMQNEANTSFESDATDGENASRASSSLAELDEYYHNGMAHTAVSKDTVLKELTSQFDHTGIRKKPKAAPGRVFRYLQSQYDAPEDSADQLNSQPPKDTLKPEQEEGQGFGYRGAKVPSPSFKFLQSQYKEEQEEPTDVPELEEEPAPYRGCPGRTFRSLQDNVETHPSVLKPRK